MTGGVYEMDRSGNIGQAKIIGLGSLGLIEFVQQDADGDGVGDSIDGCPTDPAKTAPGLCGCGVADTDGNGDGVPDCLDGCAGDPAKTAPGLCGCGVADTDSDGVPDCLDACPGDPTKVIPGLCGCGVADGDNDGDLIPKRGIDLTQPPPRVCGWTNEANGTGSICTACWAKR